ncbi:uncharacterized protein LOC129728081 isoform X2 [Wyeomyia smithii]|uniref:uncharacterized protein LOC129728081 isoform X2 n=1 Tax=Wyeomyia smithii TaxID=174621 RepID=UPI002467E9E7|nr:uncharacterized protein LOC129728081 isoform X2 [Wyeomyia smithii]
MIVIFNKNQNIFTTLFQLPDWIERVRTTVFSKIMRIFRLLSVVTLYASESHTWGWPWSCSINVDFEVMEPQGLMLWTARKPNTKLFGIELYINPTGKNDQCYLCKNITEVTHGKFLISDDNVVVKRGDVLEYVVITDNGKTAKRHKREKLVVKDYMIKSQSRCAYGFPSTRLSSVHNTESNKEIELLERIITSLSVRCAEGAVSNYLLLQVSTAAGPSNLLERVQEYLPANTTLQPYASTVITAGEYADGIAFQVQTIVDKLKILELSHTGSDIVDFDGITTTDRVDMLISDD